MNKNIVILTTILSLSLINIESAIATEDTNISQKTSYNHHVGLYSDIRVGTNFIVGPLVTIYNGDYSESGGWAWGADLGYSLTPHFGMEAGFAQSYRQEREDHLNVPYAAMKFTVPIGQRAAVFFKLGGMYVYDVSPDADTNNQAYPFEGIGISYALNNKVDLTAQLQGSFYGIYNMGVAGVGLTYHF